MDPPYDYIDQGNTHNSDTENWWNNQLYTLGAGLVCGLVFNVLVRLFQSTRRPPDDSTMGNRPASIAKLASELSTNNKMVFVVRTDLGMGKGKSAAQCAHAAIECYRRALKETPLLVRQWEVFGQAKVALKTDNEHELQELKMKAKKAGLVAYIVRDAGRTQVEEGAPTVLGVGPGPVEEVDKITGHLKLY